jgi:hypothetical protein
VAEISWSKKVAIMEKCKDQRQRKFYIKMTKHYGWTKDVLINNIENKAVNVPIGVATYSYYESLPEEMRSMLPSPEDIAAPIADLDGAAN